VYKLTISIDTYIVRGKAPKLVRKIYENVTYSQFEEERIAEFKKAIALDAAVKLPDGFCLYIYNISWKHCEFLKMLECGSYKVKDSMKCLKQHLEWRSERRNHELSEISKPILVLS
jgi:hypothetical protein